MAWGDYGFVAADDHDHVLRAAVPAQRSAGVDAVIEASGVRSPLPRLFVLALSQSGLALGFAEPVDQVRWIYLVLGTISMLSVWAVYAMHRELGRKDWALQALVWSGCHFLSVFVATRVLLESMAAPFLTLSGVLLVFYARRLRLGWLLGSLAALTLASLFRFQAGSCLPVLIAAPLVLGRRRDLIPLAAAGVFLFACTGWLDFSLRGSFHASLRAYLSHNVGAGTDYGASAWYNYILLLLGASLPPLLFSRFRNFPWKDYRELWPVIAMTSLSFSFTRRCHTRKTASWSPSFLSISPSWRPWPRIFSRAARSPGEALHSL